MLSIKERPTSENKSKRMIISVPFTIAYNSNLPEPPWANIYMTTIRFFGFDLMILKNQIT